jgi:CBS domain-containing protein
MQAKDVMTTGVVTVTPETQIQEIAKLLLERKISGVPVVDPEERVLGVVSEGDLMQRLGSESGRHRSWWLGFVASSQERAEEYVKRHGSRAADVMTRDVVTVAEETPIGEIARILEERRIKRVPVVRDGKLVGIISRANLLHGLAARKEAAPGAPSADDRSIREAVMADLAKEGWVTHGSLNVIVTDGVVELWGWVESDEERRAFKITAENVPGVRSVEDHLGSVAPWVWGA